MYKNKIYWCNLKILIDALSDNEHNNLKDEYKLRNRFEKNIILLIQLKKN